MVENNAPVAEKPGSIPIDDRNIVALLKACRDMALASDLQHLASVMHGAIFEIRRLRMVARMQRQPEQVEQRAGYDSLAQMLARAQSQ